jgi:hypothetical protein
MKMTFQEIRIIATGPCITKVITVRDTPSYGHAPTYQISLTYLERQKCYGPDKKILFKKQLFDLEVKGPTKVIMVCDTLPYGLDKLHWEEAEEKIRLKQYVSLRRGDIIELGRSDIFFNYYYLLCLNVS